jgi:hypothetical protein
VRGGLGGGGGGDVLGRYAAGAVGGEDLGDVLGGDGDGHGVARSGRGDLDDLPDVVRPAQVRGRGRQLARADRRRQARDDGLDRAAGDRAAGR